MTTVAALDLGSNSFHLLVADVGRAGRIKRRHTAKVTLRLGEPVARTGSLGEEASARAEAALAELLDEARAAGARSAVVVATDALRRADDGPAFLARVAERHSITVQVLSGMDEGALSLLAMRAALRVPEGEGLVGMDLGGGSFEIVHSTGGPLDGGASLPLGVSRLGARVRHDPPRFAERVDVFTEATALLGPVAAEVRAAREAAGLGWPARAAATAGTIRDLGRFGLALATGTAPEKVRGVVVSRDQLERACAHLCSVDLAERADLPGVSTKRADLLPVGGTILLAVMATFDLEHLTLCDWGLREGVMLDAVGAGRIIDVVEGAPR